jgi:hypothetical protein
MSQDRQGQEMSLNERFSRGVPGQLRIKLISCEVLFRETCHCAARSRSFVDPTFMQKGLHDIGAGPMSSRLQEAIDSVDPARYDAIVLGYALCNNGIVGLHASVPLVIPRAHDCISLILGSRQRYAAYFSLNPGTFYYSSGWIERNRVGEGLESIATQLGLDRSYQELVAKYGEDNARYIYETMQGGLRHYKKLAFIDTGLGDLERYRQYCRQVAEENGWEIENLQGDVGLLQRLLDGEWDSADFLVIRPGESVAASAGDDIICATQG